MASSALSCTVCFVACIAHLLRNVLMNFFCLLSYNYGGASQHHQDKGWWYKSQATWWSLNVVFSFNDACIFFVHIHKMSRQLQVQHIKNTIVRSPKREKKKRRPDELRKWSGACFWHTIGGWPQRSLWYMCVWGSTILHTKLNQMHNMIQIHNNVMWDWHYSTQDFHIFFTFKLSTNKYI